jgi:uncharacterized protein YqeY
MWNAVRNAEIDAGSELDDAAVVRVLATELKRRRESAEAYRQGAREDLATQEDLEAAVIEEFLPSPPTDDEIREIVTGVVSKIDEPSMRHMGAVMKDVLAALGGAADGKVVSRLVREALGAN